MKNWDAAGAVLEAYQARLDKAMQDGPKSYDAGAQGLAAERRRPRDRPRDAHPARESRGVRIFGYTEQQMWGKRATEFIVMQETANARSSRR
jgi:hypothetical protein